MNAAQEQAARDALAGISYKKPKVKTLHRLMFEYLTPEEYKYFCRVRYRSTYIISRDYSEISKSIDVARVLSLAFQWMDAESPERVAGSKTNYKYWSDVRDRIIYGPYP